MFGIWSDAFVFLTGVQVLIDEDDERSIASDVFDDISIESGDSDDESIVYLLMLGIIRLYHLVPPQQDKDEKHSDE
jgi:hypothetical protein